MHGLIRHCGTVATAFSLSASIVAAQQVLPVNARGPLSEPLVRVIARYALPTRPPAIVANDQETARQAISIRCGRVQSGYFDEFKTLNAATLVRDGRLALTEDDQLGPIAKSLSWPACVTEPRTPEVQKGGHALPGQPIVQGPTIELQPNNHVAMDDLIAKIEANAAPSDDQLDQIDYGSPRPALTGRLVASIDDKVAPAGLVCAATRPPFDAQAVAAYYALARQRSGALKRPQGDVRAVVFDNGFYGFDPSATPKYSSAFPEVYFADWAGQRGDVGPVISINGELFPWLDVKKVPPGFLPSHGTHVAGLVLGGPQFTTYRSVFAYPGTDNVWLQLAIVNLANGSDTLIAGSSSQLTAALDRVPGAKQGRIVNLSVAYYELDGQSISTDFEMLTRSHSLDLFVVAAGNDSDDPYTLSAYPAKLGGSRPNVITVGAHNDGDPIRLTGFSNRGSHVEIAAPGCGIESWVGMNETRPMSGTSQAAPLVTFTALLLRSLDQDLYPGDIRKRILASADVYDADPNADVAPRLKLSIPKALLMFDDYVRLSSGETYIGDVETIKALRCKGDFGSAASGRPLRDILAYKTGVGAPQLMLVDEQPCVALIAPPGNIRPRLKMSVRYRLDGYKITSSNQVITVDLDKVVEIVRRAPPVGHYSLGG